MLQRVIEYIVWAYTEAVKFAKWLSNPTNGAGQYVTPSNRHFLTGKANLLVAVAYRLGEAGMSLAKVFVLDVVAPFVDAIVGVARDLYHANTKYTRMAVRGVASAGQTMYALGVTGLILLVGLFRK